MQAAQLVHAHQAFQLRPVETLLLMGHQLRLNSKNQGLTSLVHVVSVTATQNFTMIWG
jgi:hypothetical protein